VRHKPDSVP